MGFGGDLDKDCASRGLVDHDLIAFVQCEGRSGCYAGAAAPEQVGFGGDMDEDCVGRRLVDHDWFGFGQCGASSWLLRRGGGPEASGVCCGVWSTRVGDGSSRLYGFWPCFPYKQGTVQFVWFLDPVSLINWVISSIYSGGGYDHFKVKKKREVSNKYRNSRESG